MLRKQQKRKNGKRVEERKQMKTVERNVKLLDEKRGKQLRKRREIWRTEELRSKKKVQSAAEKR